MTIRLLKAVLIGLAALLLAGIGVARAAMVLGEEDDSGDEVAETTSSPSTDASDTTPEAATEDQQNEEIAQRMAAVGGGKPLAQICEELNSAGDPKPSRSFASRSPPWSFR